LRHYKWLKSSSNDRCSSTATGTPVSGGVSALPNSGTHGSIDGSPALTASLGHCQSAAQNIAATERRKQSHSNPGDTSTGPSRTSFASGRIRPIESWLMRKSEHLRNHLKTLQPAKVLSRLLKLQSLATLARCYVNASTEQYGLRL
jgi:hypothetical protein